MARYTALLALALALSACCDASDDACTAEQNAALEGLIAVAAGYQAGQPPRPVFVSCTSNRNIVNCIGQ